MDFCDAIKAVKEGHRAKRLGWNGQDQYIALAKNIIFNLVTLERTYSCYSNSAIVFYNPRNGFQVGWLASQGDMLADDWVIEL